MTFFSGVPSKSIQQRKSAEAQKLLIDSVVIGQGSVKAATPEMGGGGEGRCGVTSHARSF